MRTARRTVPIFCISAVLLAGHLLTSCVHAPTVEHGPSEVSLLRLIAIPERFADREIITAGYLVMDDCEDGRSALLYGHKEDYQQELRMNALPVQLPETMLIRKQDFNKTYVGLRGHFRTRPTSIASQFEGEITGVILMVTHPLGPQSRHFPTQLTSSDPFDAPGARQE